MHFVVSVLVAAVLGSGQQVGSRYDPSEGCVKGWHATTVRSAIGQARAGQDGSENFVDQKAWRELKSQLASFQKQGAYSIADAGWRHQKPTKFRWDEKTNRTEAVWQADDCWVEVTYRQSGKAFRQLFFFAKEKISRSTAIEPVLSPVSLRSSSGAFSYLT